MPVRFGIFQRIEYQRDGNSLDDGDFLDSDRVVAAETAALHFREQGQPAYVLPRQVTALPIDIMATENDAEGLLEAMAEREFRVPRSMDDITGYRAIPFLDLTRAAQIREVIDGREVEDGDRIYSWERVVAPEDTVGFGAYQQTIGLIDRAKLQAAITAENPFIVETASQTQGHPA